jgi:hypothetical protein
MEDDFEKWFKSSDTVLSLVLIDEGRPTYSGLIKDVAKLAFEAGKHLLMQGVPLKCAACEYLSTPKQAGCIRGSGFDKYCVHNEIKTEERAVLNHTTNGFMAPGSSEPSAQICPKCTTLGGLVASEGSDKMECSVCGWVGQTS